MIDKQGEGELCMATGLQSGESTEKLTQLVLINVHYSSRVVSGVEVGFDTRPTSGLLRACCLGLFSCCANNAQMAQAIHRRDPSYEPFVVSWC